MIAFWRGWGILVLLVPLFWLTAIPIGIIASGWYEPDAVKAMTVIYRLGAAAVALATATLWLVTRHREQSAPGIDSFIFIPMRYWVWVIALFVPVLLMLSLFPILP